MPSRFRTVFNILFDAAASCINQKGQDFRQFYDMHSRREGGHERRKTSVAACSSAGFIGGGGGGGGMCAGGESGTDVFLPAWESFLLFSLLPILVGAHVLPI
jgi:hypothetical protein